RMQGAASGAPTPCSLLILDLDGPILEGRERQYACYRNILTESGFTAVSLECYWEMKRARVPLAAQLAATGAEALRESFPKRWLEEIESDVLLERDTVQPGAKETLAAWQEAGLRMVLATQRRNAMGLHRQL